MQTNVSSIWRHLPADLASRVERCIRNAVKRLASKGRCYIFFRADDVAVPGRNLDELLDIFKCKRVPLCLAVVPAWITGRRWQWFKDLGAGEPTLWCWHQHGWRHVNHETDGKKQEFGAPRSPSDIKRDLAQGKHRLEDILGEAFYPVFTPPWNRCGFSTLESLQELGYVAVSRSCGSEPKAAGGLPDFCVNVDLHTRKERDPASGWRNLLAELQQAISSGRAGIMIHHQRMNAAAFDFLDILLKILVKNREIQLINFRDLVENDIVG